MTDLVPLSADHPGFQDAEYRARRNAIAQLALAHTVDAPVPDVDYTADEISVWRTVWKHLAPLHSRFAVREYQHAQKSLHLAQDRVPQLREVNLQLATSGGFAMHPVAGLVTAKGFLSRLGERVFLSTQYMRHPSVPLYTPEPDVVHELIGHAGTLAHPLFADLNQAFGLAAARADAEGIAQIERVYWFSLEFGLARENGELKAFGAGLLSSFGELGEIAQKPQLVPWNLEAVARAPYDPTQRQATLFVAEQGLPALSQEILNWLRRWTG
jgi:phenylalanine-4-hydroxylase